MCGPPVRVDQADRDCICNIQQLSTVFVERPVDKVRHGGSKLLTRKTFSPVLQCESASLRSSLSHKTPSTLGAKRKPSGVASVTVDVENVVLSRILSRYSSLAPRWSGKRPMYQQTLIPQHY